MAIFSGTMMDDVLRGGMEDDVLWGGMGDDELSGGGGNDRLIGGPGADMLNGGPGMDIASYTDSPMGVHIDMSTPFANAEEREPIRGGDAEGDTLGSIEIIWGSAFADVIKGTHSHNELYGNGGSDMLYGMRGNDLLRGGYDDDQLVGGDGMDTLYGDMGVDDLQGGDGDDMLFGGEDDDILSGGMGDDVLEGGAGADELIGGDGSDTAAYTMSPEGVMVDLRYPPANPGAMPPVAAPMGGHAMGDMIGADIENLRGSMYDDTLIGDDMVVNLGADDAEGGEGTDADTVTYDGKNKLYGNMGDDKLMGMGGNDTLHGGKGNDTLYGGAGNDTLKGEMGDDALKGEDGDDVLVGGAGADKLFGGMFNPDTMMAGEDDSMNDTADYSMSDAGVTVDLGAKSRITGRTVATAEGGHAEGDELYGIENLTGSAHTDLLKGGDEDNVLKGMGGDDWDDPNTSRVTEGGLFGGNGEDELYGGDGNDWLDASGRMETALAYTDDGTTTDDESLIARHGNVTAADGTVSSNTANLIEGGRGNDMLIGGAGHDMTEMDLGDDDAVGGTDDDADTMGMKRGLYGGAGDDTLNGGAGMDMLDGGSGNDTVTYAASMSADAAGVTVNLGTTIDLGTNGATDPGETPGLGVGDDAQGDQLTGIENLVGSDSNDLLVGNRGANTLTGGMGQDTLVGGGGDDVLIAGSGGTDATAEATAQVLIGGTGADTFVFTGEAEGSPPAEAADRIRDFNQSDGDKIDLSAFRLSQAELTAILEAASPVTSGTTPVHTLDLSSYGGGSVVVTMDAAFTTLSADDFII